MSARTVLIGILAPAALLSQAPPLGGDFQVNTYTTGDQDDRAVAVPNDGSFAIVWRSGGQDGDKNQASIVNRDAMAKFIVNGFVLHSTARSVLRQSPGKRGIESTPVRFVKSAGPLLFGLAVALAPAAIEAQAIPLAPEFQVNGYTTGRQGHPDVASAGDGSFVVAWTRGPGNPGVFARRYDAQGAPKGSEFQVNSGTAVPGQTLSIAADVSGGFVVVWGDSDNMNSHGQRFDSTGAKVGSQFALARTQPRVASDAAGNFVVVSSKEIISDLLLGAAPGDLMGQRFDSTAMPTGSEFLISGFTTSTEPSLYIVDAPADRAVATRPAGDFVVVWNAIEYDIPTGGHRTSTGNLGAFGQRFSKSASTIGSVFSIAPGDNSPSQPAVALDPLGNFVVIWASDAQDGDARGIRGQRFDSAGAKVGAEFQVNTYTTGDQTAPAVAIGEAGTFVVVWASQAQDGSDSGVFGVRFDRHGTRIGGEFPVNVYTSGNQQVPRIASDGLGVVTVWESGANEDGNGFGVFGRRQQLRAEKLAVDEVAAPSTTSDHNGVLEPGETVSMAPTWGNVGGVALPLTGIASVPLCAIGSPCVTAADAAAEYGTIAAGALGVCDDGSPDACYRVSASGPRPGAHWDGVVSETLSEGGGIPWRIHVGDSFSDVPRTQPFYKKIETLLHNGITSGCTPTEYCPDATVTRDAMAIFVAKGIAGGGEFVPKTGLVGAIAYDCSSGGQSLYVDIAPTDPSCKHVHYLAAENVTLGCDATHYCPGGTVTRDAMASFIAKELVAPGGGAAIPISGSGIKGSYSCNPSTPNIHFSDVPASNPFCKHIHYLWANGIVDGCTATTYCPGSTVARDAMAKFLANGLGLKLYGP